MWTNLGIHGDCCRLNWSQINIAEGVIRVVPQKTKRHHQRLVTIPIHPALGQALLVEQQAYNNKRAGGVGTEAHAVRMEQQAYDNKMMVGPVLPGIAEMYRNSRCRVADRLSKIFKAAHIQTSVKLEGRKHRTPEATFHSLRHTFVSFAANAGVPLHIVQSIVGHESTAMTRHYYHENLTALKCAVAAIPTL